ncbi:phage tail tape measure protein, TP901 family [Bacteroides pyogenes F0041]|uniref:Phage tail tape measure protein, TP901 family n=1 Tax=Bacteroides pyogenes F0041 TaxID=1321819 RepID=U2BT96_9BACE|nr:phage tail tape measure protein [Bacteroides pyogenes]ERI81414.1 phage tail tape measure protein, TP901 family [Bacteroides pyogenes F0041]
MSDLNRSIKIFIDGSDATAGVRKVEDAISRLESKISALDKSEAGYEKKSRDLKEELERKRKTLNDYNRKIEETNRVLKNLSGATYEELVAVSHKVRQELRTAVPGTQKYSAALEQNRRVTEALARAQREMRVELGCQATAWGRAAGFLNKYIGLVAAAGGLSFQVDRLRRDRDRREDVKADVQALTGLSEENIEWLERQAVRLSTTVTESGVRIRQSATEILEAYKLVGSAKPELLENKEALAAVTEQTLILASASGMTLKDAVDAVTLSLNQYGAGADQAGRYANVMAAGSKYGAAAVESVTKAVTKSGVAASSANVPIEQLVGTIETLAEKGIKDEVAGTGLKKFFLTLQTGADDTNPKIVGLETALDNLQKKQLSAAQIKKMFGEEGYNVASVLINEAEKVKYYTEAVTDTGVALEQASVKSQTAAAKLAQAKNQMFEMGVELMDKLSPALAHAAGGATRLAGILSGLIGFLVKHSRLIVTVTSGIATYSATVRLAALYETRFKNAKLLRLATDKLTEKWAKIRLASTLALSAAKYKLKGNTDLASAAMARLNATMKGNVLGLVISLLATAGVALWQFSRRTKESADAGQRFQGELIKEQRSLDNVFGALRRTGEGTEERRRLVNLVNETYGKYLPNLLTEHSSLNDINEAYKRINTSIQTQIALKIKNQAIDEVVSESVKNQADTLEKMSEKLTGALGNGKLAGMVIEDIKRITAEYNKAGAKWQTAWGQAYHSISAKYFNKQSLGNKIGGYIEDYVKEVYKMNKQISRTEAKFRPFTGDGGNQSPVGTTPDVVVTATKKGGGTGEDGEKDKLLKARLEKEKMRYEREQSELKKIYLAGNDETLQTEKQFQERMLLLKEDYLRRSISAAGAGTKEGIAFQNQLDDLKLEQKRAALQKQIDEEKAAYERQQQELKELYASGKDENLDSEAAYNDAMEQLAILHLERMLSISGLSAEQQKQIQRQLTDFKVKCMKEEQAAQKKAKEEENKKIEEQTKKEQQQYRERLNTYKQYGEEFGNAVGAVIAGQENAMQAFADTMIDILFDILGKIVEAEIAKATATAVSAQARATAEAMAMPDSVATFGASGAARAAVLTGLIMASLAAARSALKGMAGRSSGSDSSGSPTSGAPEAPKRAAVTVSQWASGRYNVIGEDDGLPYRDVPYIGPAPTGIVRRTSLVSETGAELIVNAEDLARLQKHINYPLVLSAINDARSGHVPQRAAGNYGSIDIGVPPARPAADPSPVAPSDLAALVRELQALVRTLRNLKAYVTLSDIRKAEEIDEKARKPFTRSEH